MKLYDFGTMPRDIRDLVGRTDRESFFNLPEWYALVAEHGLETGSRAGLALDDDAGFGLAFSRLPRDRVLRSCTNLYTCEFGIFGPCATAVAAAHFVGELASSLGPLDGLQLEGLDPASPTFSLLVDAIRSAGFVAKPYFGWATWYETTSGVDFPHYVSTRPSLLRNTWKRKSALLQNAPQSPFRIYKNVAEPDPLIAVYETLREQSWKSAEPYPAIIPAVIRLAARLGALRFGVLHIDGVPAAAQFWIVWAGRATIFKLVHAERLAAHSPGTLLTMEMMRNVLDDDHPSEIDFGRGDDDYKKLWLRSRRERWGIEAANPRTLRGLVWSAWIKAGRLRHSSFLSGLPGTAEAGPPTFHPS